MTSQAHVLSTCFLAGDTVWGGRGVLKRWGLVPSKSLGAGFEEDSPASGSNPTLSTSWSTAEPCKVMPQAPVTVNWVTRPCLPNQDKLETSETTGKQNKTKHFIFEWSPLHFHGSVILERAEQSHEVHSLYTFYFHLCRMFCWALLL